ncbi:MAG: pro-sigmaK processing inhibitor BofA family protein [Eubacteriales bacterium]
MTLVFLGLFLVLLVLVVISSLGKPNKLLRLSIHVLGGVVGLWIIDLLLSVFSLEVPINIFTVVLVSLLGFPGVILLTILQFIGI